MLEPKLLEILCCPKTHQALHQAEPSLIAKINSLIETKSLRDQSGTTVQMKIEGGLVREDQQCLFPVRQGIPVLLIEQSIELPNS